MGAILSLSHFSIYQFFNLFPFSVLQSNMFNAGRKLTRGIVVANLPPLTLHNNTFIVCEFMNKIKSVDLFSHISAPLPYTLQNNMLNKRRKLAFWVNFVIYHPSTLPDNMLNLWKKLTGWVLLIGLPHQNTTFNVVEHMNQRSILSCV